MKSDKNKYSLIHLENCQIKSVEKAELFCSLMDQLEKEFGIREVEISFKNIFICPDIELLLLSESKDAMKHLIGNLFIDLDKKRYGKKSRYKNIKK